MSQDARIPVDFWFDPACPWAWLTSRWILEVAKLRPVEPRWHVMSLTMLNEGRADLPEQQRKGQAMRLEAVRICIAAEQKYGPRVLGGLYTEFGIRFHHEEAPRERSTYEAALVAAGLDSALAGAAWSDEFDDALRASHKDGIDRVGTEVGTPIIAVGNAAFFGPVVSPTPRGEAAVRLWDGVLAVAGIDGFFELKRSRTRPPIPT
ncbi:mycothiol-dependent nitroreductase Rv2466c family protein [Actinoallomurus rhizosphaericola]|uniref:mycothiol-dependent nitroreductase Rv2466c family protein n=1 Tax=Actinoallomurus rhizosphaericola TaxID=2952536 RepID=UPI002093BFB8|nr:DsbA family protein [Actinoallomurus rhizosphaericola]MCO5995619.1 disulfide bond formation protein DsbA [Actinoallomurus rhizosphaericola]